MPTHPVPQHAYQHLQREDRFFEGMYRQMIKWLALAEGSRVLDVGSGAGGVTLLLAEAVGRTGKVTALDREQSLLSVVHDHIAETPYASCVTYQRADAQRLPFEDSQFDLVWCSRVIHHLPDQLAAAGEIRRVLRPGGSIALREGGLPLRFLPFDLGLGTPGLEARLEEASNRRFQEQVRGEEGFVPYHYGWVQCLRDAGFRNVGGKAFLLDVMPPFDEEVWNYLHAVLSHYRDEPELRARLQEEDVHTLEQLTASPSPYALRHRNDLHLLAVSTIYTGMV